MTDDTPQDSPASTIVRLPQPRNDDENDIAWLEEQEPGTLDPDLTTRTLHYAGRLAAKKIAERDLCSVERLLAVLRLHGAPLSCYLAPDGDSLLSAARRDKSLPSRVIVRRLLEYGVPDTASLLRDIDPVDRLHAMIMHREETGAAEDFLRAAGVMLDHAVHKKQPGTVRRLAEIMKAHDAPPACYLDVNGWSVRDNAGVLAEEDGSLPARECARILERHGVKGTKELHLRIACEEALDYGAEDGDAIPLRPECGTAKEPVFAPRPAP